MTSWRYSNATVFLFKHKLNLKSFSSNRLTEFNMREVISIHVGQGGI